jgi:hypothetical protein
VFKCKKIYNKIPFDKNFRRFLGGVFQKMQRIDDGFILRNSNYHIVSMSI